MEKDGKIFIKGLTKTTVMCIITVYTTEASFTEFVFVKDAAYFQPISQKII